MDMSIRDEAEKVIREFIKLMKTQTAAARVLKVSKQSLNYWLNHANNVPSKQLDMMKMLLQKKKNPQQIFVATTLSNVTTSASNLKISERVKLAMKFEKDSGQRRGRPMVDTKNQKKISPTWDEFSSRSDVVVAKKYGIGSKNSYRRAKQVVLSDIAELISAMDEKEITIYHAAQLSNLAPDSVRELLSKGKSEIIRFLKNDNHEKLESHSLISLNEIYHDEQLLKAQQEYKLPLCTAFAALMSFCDETGIFTWQPEQLKNRILPYTAVDFSKLLDVLSHCGLVRKDKIGNQYYGHIPLIKKYVHEVQHAKVGI